jgi:hypothetical protein
MLSSIQYFSIENRETENPLTQSQIPYFIFVEMTFVNCEENGALFMHLQQIK